MFKKMWVMGLILVIFVAAPCLAEQKLEEGDSKVSVNDAGDGYIYLMEDGTEYLRLTGGNVGIGTTGPVSLLDIRETEDNSASNVADYWGGLLVANDGTTAGQYSLIKMACWLTEDGSYIQSIGYANNIIDIAIGEYDSGSVVSEYMRIKDGGNVGIGTTAPNTKLDVESAAAASVNGQEVLRLSGNLLWGTVGSGPKMVFERRDNSYNIAAIRGYTFGSSQTGLAFETGYNNLSTKMVIDNAGNVGIGTTNPQSKLAVNGIITAKEVKTITAGWSDYVFNNDYKLASLEEVENYIKENKHLPGVPSASEVKENGLAVSEMMKVQMAKLEELTLHVIELNKALLAQNQALSERINGLEKKIAE